MMMGLALWILGLLAAVAVLLDRLLGEPQRWHPLVGFGRVANWLERRLNQGGDRRRRWAGGVGVGLLVLGPAVLVGGALLHLPLWVALSGHVLLLVFSVGACSLHQHLRPIAQALQRNDLPAARGLTARIVSRDTDQSDAGELAKAAVESALENGNDAVFGALFWFAVAGGPGALAFRLANTLDAMWGYRGRWEWAGKWAARCDDALSWLPARLTALLLAAVAGRWPRGLWAEARRTPSPCGGWPMGAMALLLKVRLHKPEVYTLNASGGAAMPVHTEVALAWSGQVAWLAAALCALVWALRGLL
jgi:adenosylcobinamide-phosphate synthase